MSAKSRLRRLLDRIASGGTASDSDCLRVLALCRELVEDGKMRRGFPTLMLYGDWSLHTRLDRAHAKEVLTRVQTILDRDFAGDLVDHRQEVSEIVGVARWRAELRQLLLKEKLPTFLTDSFGNWNAFAQAILTDLIGKPLVGSEPTDEEVSTGWGRVARSLTLAAAAEEHGVPIKWELTLGTRITVTGDVLRTEGRDAFLYD